MKHTLAKILLIKHVVELIAKERKIKIDKARDLFYNSKIINLLDDEETGLYGESPLFIYSLFQKEQK